MDDVDLCVYAENCIHLGEAVIISVKSGHLLCRHRVGVYLIETNLPKTFDFYLTFKMKMKSAKHEEKAFFQRESITDTLCQTKGFYFMWCLWLRNIFEA
jgi:hypothetical protein